MYFVEYSWNGNIWGRNLEGAQGPHATYTAAQAALVARAKAAACPESMYRVVDEAGKVVTSETTMLRRRDLNPGDLFVYLADGGHPTLKANLNELRYVRGRMDQEPDKSITAMPSPRTYGGAIQKHILDLPVKLMKVEQVAKIIYETRVVPA